MSSANEINLVTEWSDIQDPKEKKRIQNRNAQRTYRQRMKARLENLQSQSIAKAQKSASPEATRKQNDPPSGRQSVSLGDNQDLASTVVVDTRPPKLSENPTVQSQALQLNFLENTVDGGGNGARDLQPAQPIENTQSRQPSPHSERSERTIQLPEKLLLDYLRSPKELLNRLSSLQPIHDEPLKQNPRMMTRATSRPEANRPPQQQIFTPEQSDIMDFTTPIDDWTTEVLSQGRRGVPSCPVDLLNAPHHHAGLPREPVSAMDVSHSMPPPVDPPVSKHGGLNERFEFVLECAQVAGFDSFDSLIASYYSEKFGETSALANEQRLSRNRGLPKLISEVFSATTTWSDWERRGFHEEILKTTESMLIAEGERARHTLKLGLSPLLEASNWADTTNNSHAIVAIKKMIQEELPNLWALMMTLSVEDRDTWQRNRSNTVLAAIVVLRCAGRVPNEQLLSLLSYFL